MADAVEAASSLDDACQELRKLVELATVSQMLQQAMLSALMSGAAVYAPEVEGTPEIGPLVFGPPPESATGATPPPAAGSPPAYTPPVPPGYVPPPEYEPKTYPFEPSASPPPPPPPFRPESTPPDRTPPPAREAPPREEAPARPEARPIVFYPPSEVKEPKEKKGFFTRIAKTLGYKTPAQIKKYAAMTAKTAKNYTKVGKKRGRRVGRVAGSVIGRGVGRVVGGLVGKGAKTAASLGRVGATVGGAVGAVGGAAAGGFGAFTVGLVEATKAITGWTDTALATARRLAEVSGSQAAVIAEKDVRQLVRDVQRGEGTAGSSRALMEAESAREDALLPIMTALDNAMNTILTVGNQILTFFIETLGPTVTLILQFIEWIFEKIKEILSYLGATLEETKKKETDIEDVGLGMGAADAFAEIERMEAAAMNLMEMARMAGMAGGVAAPAGAFPPGFAGGGPRRPIMGGGF